MRPSGTAGASRFQFGVLPDATPIDAVELDSGRGMSATIITIGAALQSLIVPDRKGRAADVVLGFAKPADYLGNPAYFGVTVGRYANRIAAGAFTLGDRSYQLTQNDGSNALHGGLRGFDKVIWNIDRVVDGSCASVTLSYVSPDGEEGYPGRLAVSATYSVNSDNELMLDYRATTDKPTIVNITNHSYFNLAGEGAAESVLTHDLSIDADAFAPIDAMSIPLRGLRAVAHTPFDFRQRTSIGARIREGADSQILHGHGYNHCFVLNGGGGGEPRPAARLEHGGSGRVMELLTTAPGLQLYSGNQLDATQVGKSGRVYRQSDGLCLEPQLFPDSPNRPDFPSARLDPGQVYRHKIIYRFTAAGCAGRKRAGARQ